ncbi:MAG: hypothetical protein J5682_00465, partial [Prevotella sp.]|nr:hypothetical protein [Prevotella sp.]
MRSHKKSRPRVVPLRWGVLLLCLTCYISLLAQTDTLPTREHTLDGVTVESHHTDRQVTASKPLQQLNRE